MLKEVFNWTGLDFGHFFFSVWRLPYHTNWHRISDKHKLEAQIKHTNSVVTFIYLTNSDSRKSWFHSEGKHDIEELFSDDTYCWHFTATLLVNKNTFRDHGWVTPEGLQSLQHKWCFSGASSSTCTNTTCLLTDICKRLVSDLKKTQKNPNVPPLTS